MHARPGAATPDVVGPPVDRRLGMIRAAVAWARKRLALRRTTCLQEALALTFGQARERDFYLDGRLPQGASPLHAIDPGTTELEVLQLLHALVCLFKPERVLETGTFRGFGTLALALGVEQNGSGRVTSIDIDPEAHRLARRHIRVFDPRLLRRIELIQAEAMAYLREYDGPPFGFAFLDSVPAQRVSELELLLERRLLEVGGVCVLHDTDVPRLSWGGPQYTWQGLDRLERIAREHEGLRFEHSRGFVLVKLTPKGL